MIVGLNWVGLHVVVCFGVCFCSDFLQSSIHTFRTQIMKMKVVSCDCFPAVALVFITFSLVTMCQKPTSGIIYACSEFAPWQVNALKFMGGLYQEGTPHIPKNALSEMNKVVPTDPEMKKYPKVPLI